MHLSSLMRGQSVVNKIHILCPQKNRCSNLSKHHFLTQLITFFSYENTYSLQLEISVDNFVLT
jgi:hypothetical protein